MLLRTRETMHRARYPHHTSPVASPHNATRAATKQTRRNTPALGHPAEAYFHAGRPFPLSHPKERIWASPAYKFFPTTPTSFSPIPPFHRKSPALRARRAEDQPPSQHLSFSHSSKVSRALPKNAKRILFPLRPRMIQALGTESKTTHDAQSHYTLGAYSEPRKLATEGKTAEKGLLISPL